MRRQHLVGPPVSAHVIQWRFMLIISVISPTPDSRSPSLIVTSCPVLTLSLGLASAIHTAKLHSPIMGRLRTTTVVVSFLCAGKFRLGSGIVRGWRRMVVWYSIVLIFVWRGVGVWFFLWAWSGLLFLVGVLWSWWGRVLIIFWGVLARCWVFLVMGGVCFFVIRTFLTCCGLLRGLVLFLWRLFALRPRFGALRCLVKRLTYVCLIMCLTSSHFVVLGSLRAGCVWRFPLLGVVRGWHWLYCYGLPPSFGGCSFQVLCSVFIMLRFGVFVFRGGWAFRLSRFQ